MVARAWLGVGVAVVALVLVDGSAFAFVKACHQGITDDALDAAAWPLGLSPPARTADDQHLVAELPFGVPDKAQNAWALAVLEGTQYNDQGKYDLTDLVSLAELAGRTDLQREHCLRATADDGEVGDAQAIAACRAFILEEIDTALGTGDAPDLEVKEAIRLSLVFRGPVDVSLSRYGFHVGRAIHALQDSFTHTFRNADDNHKVRTVLNWVEWIHGAPSYVEARDGFHHLMPLDQCDTSVAGGLVRRAGALQATSEFLAALADDGGGRAGRVARANQVLDTWFAREPGCTAANSWCDDPERNLPSLGCAVGGGHPRSNALALVAIFALAMSLARSRLRRARKASRGFGTAALLVLPILFLATATAHAKDVTGNVIPKATPQEQRVLESHPFGVVANMGFSIDNASANFGLGIRYDLGKVFTIGLDGEYNPWVSLEERRSVAGATNVYATGIYRLDVRDYLELRVTVNAGVSVMNYDSISARKGTYGPYLALSPLGIAFRMGSRWRLIVDPAAFVYPVPQPRGIPLVYREHRLTIGLQANF